MKEDESCACECECGSECECERQDEMIPVRIVKEDGMTVLAEYQDDETLRRCYLPFGLIEDGKVAASELEAALTYGFPFEEVIKPEVTPERIAACLRKRGLWTIEDVKRQPNMVILALQEAYAIDLRYLKQLKER